MLEQIFVIVEGHGEVEALPVLLRRLMGDRSFDIPRPFRLPRTKMSDCQEFRNAVAVAALKTGENGGILIVLDADDDPACRLGPQLLGIAGAAARGRPVGVVVAERGYEAWLLASAPSLRGDRRVRDDAEAPPDPQAIRDAKGYLSTRILRPDRVYSPTVDQAGLTHRPDPALARRCSSFAKLERELDRLLTSR